jgi:acyl transferase domain-containing protein
MKGDMASFDSQFFNLTNTEVATMDPQQRVLMENVYHALENG